VAAVVEVNPRFPGSMPLTVASGVDMPPDLPELDYVLVADHQLPRPGGPMSPRAATEALAAGSLAPAEVIADLIEATVASLSCYDQVVVAHVFSIPAEVWVARGPGVPPSPGADHDGVEVAPMAAPLSVPALMSTLRGLACSATGRRTVRTPLV
jgi:hypothetical protein